MYGLSASLILPLMRTTGKQEVKKKVLVLRIRMCYDKDGTQDKNY